MKILLSWLHEHLPIQPTAIEVRDALISVGIEVTSVRFLGEGLEDVIVARVEEVKKHPGADRLNLCRVNDGMQELSIVCGAQNMKAGDYVALARVGATLPNGVNIKKSKIRGETSEGMLCSEEELKFAETSEGILILPRTTSTLGMKLKDLLARNDWLLELDLTPNRGDCLSVIGVAREVAAALEISPKIPGVGASGPSDSLVKAFVNDRAGCPRYSLRFLEEIKVGPSVPALSRRLEACGVRPINNVVDVTNYVMLEWGQPMHAFDKDKVVGTVKVRRAEKEEKILCLDNVERKLNPADLVIADDEGAIAIAGVIGGDRTSVTPTTKTILLESACFDSQSVRKTSRRLGLQTEASYRFERHVDPAGVWSASDKAVSLFQTATGGKEVAGIDLKADPRSPRKISLRKATLLRILGDEMKKAGEYLARLGFSVEKHEDSWMVEIPSRRPDLEREIDLVEEVARIHGYNQFVPLLPSRLGKSEENVFYEQLEIFRDLLCAVGFQESRTYSFTSDRTKAWLHSEEPPLKVANPITDEMKWMRYSLAPNLIEVWKNNHARQIKGAKIYEIGSIFLGSTETTHLTAVIAGEVDTKSWTEAQRSSDFYDGKGLVEFLFERLRLGEATFELPGPSHLHPGKSTRVFLKKKFVGSIGELHPNISKQLEVETVVLVDLDLTALLSLEMGEITFAPLSSFPFVERDLAFLVSKNVSAATISDEIRKLKDPLLQDVRLFDLYEGKKIPEGEKSVAYTLRFASPERTLTDPEVEGSLKKIVAKIQKTFGATLRGEI